MKKKELLELLAGAQECIEIMEKNNKALKEERELLREDCDKLFTQLATACSDNSRLIHKIITTNFLDNPTPIQGHPRQGQAIPCHVIPGHALQGQVRQAQAKQTKN